MAINADSITAYTAAELLKGVEYAIMRVAVGGVSVTINGRSFTNASLSELRKMREALKTEVAESGSTTGTMTALARFGCQQ